MVFLWDELLMLLLQVLLETLEGWCHVVYLLLVGIDVLLTEIVQCLCIDVSLRKQVSFVQTWCLALLFVCKVSWIYNSWSRVERHCIYNWGLGWNDVRYLWLNHLVSTTITWESLVLKDHVYLVFKIIDIGYALKSVMVLLIVLWIATYILLTTFSFLKTVWLTISSAIQFDCWTISLIHLNVYYLVDRLICHDHITCIGCNCCEVSILWFHHHRLSLITRGLILRTADLSMRRSLLIRII